MVLPEFVTAYEAHCQCNTENINHAVNNLYTDVFSCVDVDWLCSFHAVKVQRRDIIRSMIHQGIRSPGKDPVLAQHHTNQGSINEYHID